LLSDEWALGIIFYKLCSNNVHPFNLGSKTVPQIIEILKTQELKFPKNFFSERGFDKDIE